MIDIIQSKSTPCFSRTATRPRETQRNRGGLRAHCSLPTSSPARPSRPIQANPGRRIVKVATLAVSGDVAGAISELQAIDLDNSMTLFSPIAFPVDQLPVFEALYDQESFRKYANRERYRIADQARMRASGETKEEIQTEVLAAGYTLRD